MKAKLRELALRIPQIRNLVEDRNRLQTELQQLTDALAHSGIQILPIPPRHLQERVVGGYVPGFLSSANRTLADFEGMLAHAEKSLSDFKSVLELGVGCGRILRRFHEMYPDTHMTGVDIDAEAIAWLNENYGPAGEFIAAPHLPPTEMRGNSFDLVYAVSVFTHLDEQMQFSWLAELARVTTPGGHLLLTVHGKQHHNYERSKRLSTGFYFDEECRMTDGLPSFYRNSYHTREYVERSWAKFFDIIHYSESGCEGHQDLILCQKRVH